MKFTRRVSSANKGKMKCFRCRETGPSQDGNWHDFQNQQVFLCSSCERLTLVQEKVPHDAFRHA